MGWKEITPDFMSFETKGQSLEGELMPYTELRIKDVPVRKWGIKKLADGVVTAFLGGVALDPMLDAVSTGTVIKLEYDGSVKIAGGYNVKTFKLYVQATDEKRPPTDKK